MALSRSILCALLILATACHGKPHVDQKVQLQQGSNGTESKQKSNLDPINTIGVNSKSSNTLLINKITGSKPTGQDLLDIILKSDNPGEEIKDTLRTVLEEVDKQSQVKTDNKVQGGQDTPASQVHTTTNRPFRSDGQNYQGFQYTYTNRLSDSAAVSIQKAHITEAAARTGQANAIQNAQALDAARAANVQRVHVAALENARAAEAARRTTAARLAEEARAAQAERVAIAAHVQAERIASAARNNLMIAAANAAGPAQVSNVINSAAAAFQRTRMTEVAAGAEQANAMHKAQALDAVRVANIQSAQAAAWERAQAAEAARRAAAATAIEMARAAEAQRVAYAAQEYAAREQAAMIANIRAVEAARIARARYAQEGMYLEYGYPYF